MLPSRSGLLVWRHLSRASGSTVIVPGLELVLEGVRVWLPTPLHLFSAPRAICTHQVLTALGSYWVQVGSPWHRPAALICIPGGRNYFSHCSSGPPVHFTHQTLTMSSFGYLLWRNKRHCYPFYYSKKKRQQEDLNSHPENKQCNAVLHVALPTAPRAVDGSKGGLTNLYLGLNHQRWIGCMQMSTRGLWLAVCKWVRTGVRNCSGINNLAPGGGGVWGIQISLSYRGVFWCVQTRPFWSVKKYINASSVIWDFSPSGSYNWFVCLMLLFLLLGGGGLVSSYRMDVRRLFFFNFFFVLVFFGVCVLFWFFFFWFCAFQLKHTRSKVPGTPMAALEDTGSFQDQLKSLKSYRSSGEQQPQCRPRYTVTVRLPLVQLKHKSDAET